MKKYIFATDVDGTLLMDNGEINPETLNAFKKAYELGHIIVIATGRCVKRSKVLLSKIPYVNYFVCNNGAVVHDIKKDNSFILHSVNPHHYIKMHDFALKNNVIFKLHTDIDWIGYKGNEQEDPTPLTEELDQKIREHILKNPNDKKLFNGQTITQLSICSSPKFCKNNIDYFVEEFKNDSSIYLTNSIYIDVNPKDKSKWTGLVELANKLNISKENIITFGDSGNDYEMIFNAGINGYALENSHPDLKEKIKPRIGNNNSNAIGLKILEYIEK